eukprot:scaffold11139_cov19-Tisochrysis_lutea.AAC.2
MARHTQARASHASSGQAHLSQSNSSQAYSSWAHSSQEHSSQASQEPSGQANSGQGHSSQAHPSQEHTSQASHAPSGHFKSSQAHSSQEHLIQAHSSWGHDACGSFSLSGLLHVHILGTEVHKEISYGFCRVPMHLLGTEAGSLVHLLDREAHNSLESLGSMHSLKSLVLARVMYANVSPDPRTGALRV